MAFELTEKQAALRDAAAGPAMHILGFGGSRSGKTFGFCYCVAIRTFSAPGSRHLICRLKNNHVRQSVMMDTWPKMMKLAFPGVDYELNKSDQFCTFENEQEVWFGGLDDKDRVDKILGKEYATVYANEASQIGYAEIVTLRSRLAQAVNKRPDTNGVVRPLALKAYYDLNPVGQGHWTYQEFINGIRPIDRLPLQAGRRTYVVLNPTDNPHLPAEYVDELRQMPERQRQRYYSGKYQTEVPGTLWPSEVIDRNRVASAPELTRIVVAVDPSGSDGSGGDSQGIVVVGKGVDGDAYVLRDASCRLGPDGWARRAVSAADEFEADCIVAEANFGGAMVESTIRTQKPDARVKMVTASRGKHIRAEPVSAIYEQNKVHHVGLMPELEEQLGMMTTEGYQGVGSPDRLDALVWALTELMVGPQVAGFGILELARRELEAANVTPEPPAPQCAPGSMEWLQANGLG